MLDTRDQGTKGWNLASGDELVHTRQKPDLTPTPHPKQHKFREAEPCSKVRQLRHCFGKPFLTRFSALRRATRAV